MERHLFWISKSTISMAVFNSKLWQITPSGGFSHPSLSKLPGSISPQSHLRWKRFKHHRRAPGTERLPVAFIPIMTMRCAKKLRKIWEVSEVGYNLRYNLSVTREVMIFFQAECPATGSTLSTRKKPSFAHYGSSMFQSSQQCLLQWIS